MHSPLPKVVHPVCGRAMIAHVLEAVKGLSPGKTVLVVGVGREAVEEAAGDFETLTAVQDSPRGTGDAARAGLAALGEASGDVLVLPGDTPLLTAEVLRALTETHARQGHDATVLTFTPPDPGSYGRVIRNEDGSVSRIVEARDAGEPERSVREVNSGIYCFRSEALFEALPRIGAGNAASEYYLTEVVELMERGSVGAVAASDPAAVLGINTPEQLAEASRLMEGRILASLLAGGVSVPAPDRIWVEWGVEVGENTTLLPFSVLRRGVKVGRGCTVGPFAHLRGGTVVRDGAWVGSFVEANRSEVGEGSAAGHLAYLGDARIGRGATVGAGAVTANFDGKEKHGTIIEDGAMIGAGTVLVAPVRVGSGATTGAGAVVTGRTNVPPGDVVVGVPARSRRTRTGPEPPPSPREEGKEP